MEKRISVALLEDDMDVGTAIKHWLESAGYAVQHFTSGRLLKRVASDERFELFVLDWGVPDLSGKDILQWLRHEQAQNSAAPVLFVTSHNAEEDIVLALSAGADDYMVKPIRQLELQARVGALLRRGDINATRTGVLDIGSHYFDPDTRVAYVGDSEVELKGKEFDVALFLFRHLGNLVSRGHIAESVWGARADQLQSRTVDHYVSLIRKKLSLDPAHGMRLTSISNFGYRLEQLSARPIAPSEARLPTD